MEPLLYKQSFLVSSGGVGLQNEPIELIEVALCDIASPCRIRILHLDRDDTALLVV